MVLNGHSTLPVTVLMCVYNEERFVRESVESILGQSFGDFEFLIVDDACTDDTVSIVTSFHDERIRVIRNDRNMGLAASLNRGLSEARGRFLARQDADDVSLPDRLREQYEFMSQNPGVAVAGGMAFLIDESGNMDGEFNYPVEFEDLFVELFFLNPLIHGSVLCDLSAVRNVGGYDESFDRTQDYDLWVRIVAAGGRIRNLPQKLLKYRRHGESLTGSGFARQENLARNVIRKAYKLLLDTSPDDKGVDLLREFLLKGRVALSRSQVLSILRLLRLFRRSLSRSSFWNERVGLAMERRLDRVLGGLVATGWKRNISSLFVSKF